MIEIFNYGYFIHNIVPATVVWGNDAVVMVYVK